MMNTSTVAPGTKARSPQRQAGLILLVLFVVFAYGILAVAPDSTSIQTLSVVFAGIMLEAMPMMLFGALVGGLIETFISRERMTRILPKKGTITIIFAAGMGVLFPVCECAVVPVVRRLLGKGLPASAAIAYLLGGPIVNPIVGVSTALAYKFDWQVAGMRLGLGYLIAVTVAFIMGRIFDKRKLLHQDILDNVTVAFITGRELDLEKKRNADVSDEADKECIQGNQTARSDACDCGCELDFTNASFRTRVVAAFRHAAEDFVSVGHYLVIGAFIAALAQTYIDRKVFLDITEHPVLPSLAMMLLAVLLNLCSEADAFIAASFRGLMPFQAQMAFMLVGPMFDLKLLLMYQGVFRKRAIVTLAGLILVAVFVAVLGISFFGEQLK
ncbi:MAG: permease [Deltaproteobacteria bacterium]|nr:permease [Deltaproteobacteria bacterium]